jgi:magnesium chelatase family protein
LNKKVKFAFCKYPCPFGYYQDPVKPCICSAGTATKYQKRVSRPLLDRIDIHIDVTQVEYEKLSDSRLGEKSSVVQRLVTACQIIYKLFSSIRMTPL